MRSISLIGAMLLLGSGLAAAQTAASAAAPARAKAAHGAAVFIESPRDGATVGQDVTVKFGAKGVAIKPAGDTTPDSGHHHLLIDATDLPPANAPIPNDATHKHYGKAQTEDTIHLEPGKHTLQLDLGDAAHMQFDPPVVSKKITITVK
jgi:hypothetical protein